MEINKKQEKIKKNVLSKYSKEQIIKSNLFKENRDLINALLKDEEKYTKLEIEKLIKDYQRKKVN